MILLLGQIEHILESYVADGDFGGVSVRQLLSKSQIHFVPVVNPDGLECHLLYLRTKMLPEGFKKSDMGHLSANKVNLNRNYDAEFRPNVQESGPSAFSEPETRALRDMHGLKDFDYSVTYHSEGNVIFWNFSQTGEFYTRTLQIARLLQERTGYTLDMLPAKQSMYIGGTADFGGYKD